MNISEKILKRTKKMKEMKSSDLMKIKEMVDYIKNEMWSQDQEKMQEAMDKMCELAKSDDAMAKDMMEYVDEMCSKYHEGWKKAK